jgi:hypothetical protein
MVHGVGNEGFDAYVEGAAGLCEEMAALFVDGGLPPFAADPADAATWSQDRVALQVALGTDVPTAWIVRTVPTYLGEAAYQLRAVAAVLRARILTGSIGPLVRSMTERVGATTWILDPDVDAVERGWRAMLNALVCWSEYRKAAERLGLEPVDQAALESEHVALRSDVRTWFGPTEAKDPDKERSWRRGSSGYPTYTDLAVRSLPSVGPSDPFGEIQRKGLYSAQCGMTHPNVVVSGETIDVGDDGQMRFVHRAEHLDKELRVGFHSLSWGYRAWAWYFCKETDMENVMATLGELSDRLDAWTFDDD